MSISEHKASGAHCQPFLRGNLRCAPDVIVRVLLASGEIVSYFFLIFAILRQVFGVKLPLFARERILCRKPGSLSRAKVFFRGDDVRVEEMGRGIKTSDRFCQRISVNLQRKDNKTPFLMI